MKSRSLEHLDSIFWLYLGFVNFKKCNVSSSYRQLTTLSTGHFICIGFIIECVFNNGQFAQLMVFLCSCMFLLIVFFCVWLSVPVQVTDWKDSSQK